VLKVGLSWPSLAKALGREVNPKRWAVLYLGAASAATLPKDREVTLLDSKSAPLPEQERALAEIDGIIVLDGSWSQAKTLWWRNPWVLKCRRLALNPKQPSRYGKLRREPRREGLSTLEAAALALARIGRQPEIETVLSLSFARLLSAYRSLNTRAK
jgi:DTW domain-containing protein YfiP